MTPREQANLEMIRRLNKACDEAVEYIQVLEQTIKAQERISASLAEALDEKLQAKKAAGVQ